MARHHAFPSFATSVEWAEFQQLLRLPNAKKRLSLEERPYRLPLVQCGNIRADGTLCGRRLGVIHLERGRFIYKSTDCYADGHHSGISPLIEPVVAEMVLARFDAAGLAGAIDRNWANAAAAREQQPILQRAHAEALADRDAAETTERARRRDHNCDKETRRRLVLRAMKQVEIAEGKVIQAEAALAAFRADLANIDVLARADADRIIALATDLPALLRRAESHPTQYRQLMRGLISAVYVRRHADGVWEVGVEFPSGVLDWRIVRLIPVTASAAEWAWARGRADAGHRIEDIVTDRNALLLGASRPEGSLGTWSVRTLPALIRDPAAMPSSVTTEALDAIRRAGVPVDALAGEYGVSPQLMLRDVLLGYFGTAVWEGTADGANGTLLIARPTMFQSTQRYPEVARRDVARAKGWPVYDTALLAHVSAALCRPRSWIRARVLAGSGFAEDAHGRRFVRCSDLELSPLPADTLRTCYGVKAKHFAAA